MSLKRLSYFFFFLRERKTCRTTQSIVLSQLVSFSLYYGTPLDSSTFARKLGTSYHDTWTDGKSPEAQAPRIAAPMSMHSLSRARTQGSPVTSA